MGLYDVLEDDAKREMKVDGWPEGNDPIDFEKLVKPLAKALRFAYSMRRQNKELDVPWKGPDIGWRERATCFGPKQQLSAKNLTYSNDEQGRDALNEIIGLALRLGIEQGRRITMTGPTVSTLALQAKIGEMLSRDALSRQEAEDAEKSD